MHNFQEWVQQNHPKDELLTEKWGKKVKIKQTGEHKDKTIAQLKKEKEGLKGKGKPGEMAERLFAIRAKGGWKKGKGATGSKKGKKKGD